MNPDILETEKKNESYFERDEIKLNMLNEISSAYLNSDPDKSIETAQLAIKLAEELELTTGLAMSHKNLSKAYRIKGEYDAAIIQSERSLELNKSIDNNKEIVGNHLDLADIWRMKSDIGKSKESIEKALELLEYSQNQNELGRAYSLLGNVNLLTSDYQLSTEYYNKSVELYELTGNISGLAGTLSNIGGIYFFTGDYPKALEQFQKALSLNEQSGNKLWMLSNLGNIGNLYVETGDYIKGMEYFQKSFELSVDIDYKYGLITSLSNIASIYIHNNDFAKALETFQRTISLSLEIGDKFTAGSCIMNLGFIYLQLSEYKDAIENIQNAMIIFDELGNTDDMSMNYNLLAIWYIKADDEIQMKFGFDPSKKIALALENLFKSIEISEKSNNLKILKDDYKLLSEIYETNGEFKNAFDAYRKYIELRDKIEGEESKKQITRKEMQYDFDKKEAFAKAEQDKKDALAFKELQRQKLIRNSFIGGFTTVLAFAGVFFNQRNKIKKGKKLSDNLLLNILPEEVAEELKQKGSAKAKHFDEITVMFTDFKGFTQISEKLSASELVNEIDICFKAFDNIISKHNIEKIKTIGDSYMCAGGLPVVNKTNAINVVSAALEMRDYMNEHQRLRKEAGMEIFEIRIGIHTGSVVAGIVGVKKFAYDIWGNTVNIASRMESSGEEGKINISGETYQLVKDNFDCTYRGKIEAKNKGMIDMYFVNSAEL